jgi:hypothetical protein
MSDKNCPTQNNLQRLLSGEMLENERDTLELHLADCVDCRNNLAVMFAEKSEVETFAAPASLKEKVKNLPEKSKANSASFFSFEWLKINRLEIGFASILMIFLVFTGIYFWQNRQTANSDDVLRNGSANKNSVQLFAPENEANISAEKIEFHWAEMPNAKNYTLVISDEKGDIIKEISSEKAKLETTVSELGLIKEKRYFWHVKVKFADGTTSESENRKFLVKTD